MLQNYGAFIEKDGAGIRGTIKLTGFESGNIDLSKSLWTYQVCIFYDADFHFWFSDALIKFGDK
jgi:hypothetical protein